MVHDNIVCDTMCVVHRIVEAALKVQVHDEHHLTLGEMLKYCNLNPTKLVSKEACLGFFTLDIDGDACVTELAKYILKNGVDMVVPTGDCTEFSKQTTMFMDLMRCFITWMCFNPEHHLIEVLPFVVQSPFFISALTCHIGDQPSNGSCDTSMIDLAQITGQYVNYAAYDWMMREKFFNHLVKLLFTKRLHVAVQTLECVLFYVGSKNEPQLGLSITLALCRRSVGLLAGLEFLLREYRANRLQSFQWCTHYDSTIGTNDPVFDLMFVLYEVC